MATASGLLSSLKDNINSILVVAGGGGGAAAVAHAGWGTAYNNGGAGGSSIDGTFSGTGNNNGGGGGYAGGSAGYYHANDSRPTGGGTSYYLSINSYTGSNSAGVNSGAGKAVITLMALTTATVTYNGNGGTTPPPITGDVGAILSDISTRIGYTFDGWYTEASGGEKRTTIEATETLYAHWIPNVYTITFNNNGGNNNITTKTINYNEAYGDLPIPISKYGTFKGWYDNNNNKILSSDIYNITEDSILIAQYNYYYGIYMKINNKWYLGTVFVKMNNKWDN